MNLRPDPAPGSIATGRIMAIVMIVVAAFLLMRCLASCAVPTATVELRDGKKLLRVKIPQHSLISFSLSAAGGTP